MVFSSLQRFGKIGEALSGIAVAQPIDLTEFRSGTPLCPRHLRQRYARRADIEENVKTSQRDRTALGWVSLMANLP